MSNPFVYVELNSTDIDKSKAFYSQMFDWKLENVPAKDDGYTHIKTGETIEGGMREPEAEKTAWAPAWITYVNVDDINGMTKRAQGLGAHVVKDVTAVKNMGWYSIVTDPTGATFGMWQSI